MFLRTLQFSLFAGVLPKALGFIFSADVVFVEMFLRFSFFEALAIAFLLQFQFLLMIIRTPGHVVTFADVDT